MARFQNVKQRVIVALDTTNRAEISDIVGDLSGAVWGFKIGLEAIMAFGAKPLIDSVRELAPGGRIFFDAKFHDIPNTIKGAVEAITPYGVEMFNVHASAGLKGIKAAAEAKAPGMALIGVTVLTSHSQEESEAIFGDCLISEKVMQFALSLAVAGAEGLVCSAHEAKMIKANPLTQHLLAVVPGIRLPGDAAGDQSRIMTPGKALMAGADLLVIGRSLTAPSNGNRLEALALTDANIIEETLAAR